MAYLQGSSGLGAQDPYIVALIANAMLAIDPEGGAAQPVLDRLESLQHTSKDGKHAWWGGPESASIAGRTLFYGCRREPSHRDDRDGGPGDAAGRTGPGGRAQGPDLARRPEGRTWHLGLDPGHRAGAQGALAGTGKPLGGDNPRRIAILLDGEIVRELAIPAEQSDVMRQVDLSGRIASATGTHRLTIEDRSGTDCGYQVVFRYHEPDAVDRQDANEDALSIRLDYDRNAMAVDETVTVVATVANKRPEPAPMVILDLPIPAGFAIDADDLAGLVKAGTIAKFQVTAERHRLSARPEAGAPLTVRYHLRATMPVKLTVPPAAPTNTTTPRDRDRARRRG